MFQRYWLSDVFQATADDVADTKPTGGAYSQVDPGDDRVLDSPSPSAQADDATGAESSDDSGSDTEPSDETAAADAAADSEDSADTISDDLLNRALDLGWDASKLLHFRSEKSLERELTRAEDIRDRLEAKQAQSKPETDTAPHPAEALVTKLEQRLEKMLEEGTADEDQIGALKDTLEIAKLTLSENKSLKTQQQKDKLEREQEKADREQEKLQRLHQAKEQRFDAVLEKLNDKLGGAFGTGPGTKLDKNSAEFKTRNATWTRWLALQQAFPETPDEELIEEAAAAALHKRTNELARKKLVADIRKASGQTLARSRPPGTKPLEGEEKARAATREFFAKNA